MRDLITFFTKENELVFDSFMGVGGTLLGAALCNRKAAGIDLNPHYIEAYHAAANELSIADFKTACADSLSFLKDNEKMYGLTDGLPISLLLIDPPYLGMTMPMAIFALFSWLRNPYKGNKSEVKVNSICHVEQILMWFASAIVTIAFYFILSYFNTANIIPSTISVTTSFVAVYLTFRRSPFFALAYAANDIILIILWALACITNIHYISVVVCFVAFLFNDIYAFISWQKMKKRQAEYR